MSTSTIPPLSPPPPPPPQSPRNDLQQQPAISRSSSFTSIPPPLVEVHHHQQTPNSNPLPLSSPRNSVAPAENVDDHQLPPPVQVDDHQLPPPEQVDDHRQPLASPSNSLSSPPQSSHLPQPPASQLPTGAEEPVDKSNAEHESELRGSPPSLEEPRDQLETPDYSSNQELLMQQQPPPPSRSISGAGDQVENPSYSHNAISDHESPSSSPPHSSHPSSSAEKLQQDLHESPSHKSNPSPSGSPAPPPASPSPSSPQETQLAVSELLKTITSSSRKTLQPAIWTHQETANLIRAYQEKWYSLNKGQLKAGQWEEIASTVTARCGYDEPMKSAKQCRHKIEKLRKRYRTERAKPRARANAWNFFKLMDTMERGPLPISSSQSMPLINQLEPSNSSGKKRKVGDSDNKFHGTRKSSRLKSHYLGGCGVTRNLQGYVDGIHKITRGLRTPVVQKRKPSYQEGNGKEEIDGVAVKLAAEIKGFAEKFVKMENKKMEMMRDAERCRLEMETKRMEMILESQQKLVETVNKAFSDSCKKQRLPTTAKS